MARAIPKKDAPRPLQLGNPKWYVVTEANFDSFKKNFTDVNKTLVFYAVSPNDFKTIRGNQSEMLRYIQQQKATIVYYESNLK